MAIILRSLEINLESLFVSYIKGGHCPATFTEAIWKRDCAFGGRERNLLCKVLVVLMNFET